MLWSIGLRMDAGTLAGVERAIAERRIVRSWPMRGTLHVMAAEDALDGGAARPARHPGRRHQKGVAGHRPSGTASR